MKFILQISNTKIMSFIGKKIVDYSNSCVLYDTDINKIVSYTKRWERNRPEDPERILEIEKSLVNKTYVDGIIYGWYYNGTLFLYDGWTRFSACKLLEKNIKILLCVNYTKNEQKIIEHFGVLNKAIPVPSLYTKEIDNKNKRLYIESITKDFSSRYRKFVSVSRNPRSPNFNRDNFFDFLAENVITETVMNNFPIPDLFLQILEKVNVILKIQHSDMKLPDKAVKESFLLFCVKQDELLSCIKNQLIFNYTLIDFDGY